MSSNVIKCHQLSLDVADSDDDDVDDDDVVVVVVVKKAHLFRAALVRYKHWVAAALETLTGL